MRGGAAPPSRDALQDQLDHFSLKADFLRAGVEHDWNPEFKGGLDEVFLLGKYEEELGDVEHAIKFDQYTTSLFVRQQFGNYVALQVDVNLFLRKFEVTTNGDTETQNSRRPSGSMSLDFML
jgi:hypothetical protein